MRNIIQLAFLVILITFGFCVQASTAAQIPIIPQSSKTTITIEKSEIEETEFNELGEHVLKSYRSEISSYIFLEKDPLSDRFYLEDESGNTKWVEMNEMSFESSDPSIFTMDGDYIVPHKLGKANLIAFYQGKTLKVVVNIIEHDIMFKFDKLGEERAYIWSEGVSYKISENEYYNWFVGAKVDIENATIKLFDINWEDGIAFNVIFRVNDRIYSVDFDRNDKGKVIEVPYDPSNFTKVTFDVPTTDYAEELGISLIRDGIEVNTLLESDSYSTFYFMNGEYGFVYNASTVDNYYRAYVKPLKLTGGEITFDFPLEDFSELQVQTDFSKNAVLSKPKVCKTDIVYECFPRTTNQRLYLKNDMYDKANVSARVNHYEYRLNLAPLNLLNDTSITIDDEFTTEIQFGNRMYKGGELIYFNTDPQEENRIVVKNKAGHELITIFNRDNYNDYNGKLVFTNGDEIYEVPVYSGVFSRYATLPNISGTFDVTYTFDENESVPSKVRPDISGTWKDWPNTKSVASDYTWTINLSSAANAATVTINNTFVVDTEGYLVEGVQVKAEGNQIYISAPASGYEAGNYTLYIRDAVKNVEGKALANTKMVFDVK